MGILQLLYMHNKNQLTLTLIFLINDVLDPPHGDLLFELVLPLGAGHGGSLGVLFGENQQAVEQKHISLALSLALDFKQGPI